MQLQAAVASLSQNELTVRKGSIWVADVGAPFQNSVQLHFVGATADAEMAFMVMADSALKTSSCSAPQGHVISNERHAVAVLPGCQLSNSKHVSKLFFPFAKW
eukprot:CAMPEP_0177794498 /NCGR_PEP_ID=MMETSP0491_2-20121128/25684_1 /TAXON_ID=63592 /ORGANISM="Tetraselmis chuii, Strain PLY429" /LENGTH=102 /DNA_ID=CAMNT_0019317171 /DNA_START=131 /DNA_END=438 /DNA_ORIENTATION=-